MRHAIGHLHDEDITPLGRVKTASNPTQVLLYSISIVDVAELLVLRHI